MKTKIIVLIGSLLFLFQGCLVISIHPFYTEDDLLYKPEITGKWMDSDSNTWIIKQHMEFGGLFKPANPDSSYEINTTDKKGTSDFIVHLFHLRKEIYLDFYPKDSQKGNALEQIHFIPSHSLARVEFIDDRIIISWYNQDWLVGLFNKNKIRIDHERTPYDIDDKNPDNQQVVLTASTAELQKFIRKYGNDPNAFKKDKSGHFLDDDYTIVLSRK